MDGISIPTACSPLDNADEWEDMAIDYGKRHLHLSLCIVYIVVYAYTLRYPSCMLLKLITDA